MCPSGDLSSHPITACFIYKSFTRDLAELFLEIQAEYINPVLLSHMFAASSRELQQICETCLSLQES